MSREYTALRSAFAKAGYSGGKDRLYGRVVNLLRLFDGDQIQARKKLTTILQHDSDLLIAAADFCVQIIAADMAGTNLPGGARPAPPAMATIMPPLPGNPNRTGWARPAIAQSSQIRACPSRPAVPSQTAQHGERPA